MAEASILSRVIVVLYRPKSPGNVGSVARAMKNMGLSRLRIANPISFEDPEWFLSEAGRMAWGAADLLESREETPTLDSALADAVLVAGTTSAPPDGHAVLSPRDLAPRLLEAARGGSVALCLGQEDIGLTKDALARCQVLGSIPSSSAYASLNLAQAALVFLYEIRLAALSGGEAAEPGAPPAGGDPPGEPLPSQDEMEGFYGRLEGTLGAIGFLHGSGAAHTMREMRRIFNRALLTRREVRILEGILHQVNWARRRPGSP